MGAVLIFGNTAADSDSGITIEDAVASSGRLPDTYIFLSDGRPVPMTTVLKDGDRIEAIRVASGG